MTARFGGVWPAMLTPIRPDGRPDLAAAELLADLFARQQLGGIYLNGSTGQWPLLAVAERKEIAALVIKAVAGRLPVMVHVGAAATADAIELAEHAAGLGAAAVSAVGPTYYPFGPDAVFEHYRRIGAATPLPLFAYYLSGVNRMGVGPREYARRLLDVPNAAGMKYTDVDLYTFGLLHAAGGDRLQLFSGADEVMCHAVLGGAVGAIGTFYNVWGPACQSARQAAVAGDVPAASAFMRRFQTAIADVIDSGGVWTFLRAAVQRKYGIDVGMPRPPLGAADRPWAEAEVQRVLVLVDGG